MRHACGAALVLVLWLIALLTAMIGAFVLNARVEALQGTTLRTSAQAQEYARAGLEYAILRLQGSASQPRWRADGRRYRWRLDDAQIDIRIMNESGKVDLNAADPMLLAGLLRAVGVEPGRDMRLAGAIIDWRDGDALTQAGGGAEDRDYADAGLPYGAKDAPFETVSELGLVLGIDADLYRRLLPNVTLYGGRSQPESRFAPAPVLTAMGLNAAQVLAQRDAPLGLPSADMAIGGTGTYSYSIESRARLRQGREAVLHAIVRTGASALPGSAYTVLRWDEGAAVQ